MNARPSLPFNQWKTRCTIKERAGKEKAGVLKTPALVIYCDFAS